MRIARAKPVACRIAGATRSVDARGAEGDVADQRVEEGPAPSVAPAVVAQEPVEHHIAGEGRVEILYDAGEIGGSGLHRRFRLSRELCYV
jgi:hypothetical protein